MNNLQINAKNQVDLRKIGNQVNVKLQEYQESPTSFFTSSFVESNPQAAKISCPREAWIVVLIPLYHTQNKILNLIIGFQVFYNTFEFC